MSTLTFVTDALCRNKTDGTPIDCPRAQLGESMLQMIQNPALEKKCNERHIEDDNLLDPETPPNSRMMAAVEVKEEDDSPSDID